jgi:hypothetical protein
MDGTKSATDTLEFERIGREALCVHRSTDVSSCGARGIENLGGSSIIAGLESLSPEGLGFLSTVRQLRVSRS